MLVRLLLSETIKISEISLDKKSGSLSAYGKEELYVTYQPLSQANYKVEVICTINSQRHTLLTLTGEGVFPKLSFIDIRSVGKKQYTT